MLTDSQLSTRQQFMEWVRQFNKRYLNPFTLSFAGRPHSPYAIVQHVGRRSGRTYETPVVAMATGDQFVIPMPYGTHVDWHRNVQAAGSFRLASQGKAWRVGELEVIEPGEGLPAFPVWMQRLLDNAETDAYLRVTRLAETPEPQEVYRDIIAAYPSDYAVRVVLIGLLGLLAAIWLIRRLLRRGE